MLSSAGVGELAGNEILMRPEKQTGLVTSMPNSASVVNKPQVESSIVIVNEPAAVTMLLTVNETAVGGGVKLPKSYAVAVLRDGAWVAVDRQVNSPASPVGGAVNTAMFLPVATKKVRVVFTHQDNSRSGVTEIAIW